MIYFTSGAQHFLIVEQGNLKRLRVGKPLVSPDGNVLIMYTPDMEWTQEQIKELFINSGGQVDADELERLYQEGLKRPEVRR